MRVLVPAVVVSALFVTACESGPTDIQPLTPDATAFARSAPTHSVTGGGTVVYDTDPGYEVGSRESYGISARQRPDGSVEGMIEMHWPAPYDLKAHGTVTCLNVEGNQAWIGFAISRTDQPDAFPVGSQWVFFVTDNGAGKNSAPDQVSYFFRVADAALCSTLSGPINTQFDWTNGNLTVR